MSTREAEQIVRALAAADPTVFEDAHARYECTMCDGTTGEKDDLGGPAYLGREDHDEVCPWRLAVDFVAAQEDRAAHLAAHGYRPDEIAALLAEVGVDDAPTNDEMRVALRAKARLKARRPPGG